MLYLFNNNILSQNLDPPVPSAVAAVAVGAQYIHLVEETTGETETDSVKKDTIAVNAKVSDISITDEAGKAQETEIEANKHIP